MRLPERLIPAAKFPSRTAAQSAHRQRNRSRRLSWLCRDTRRCCCWGITMDPSAAHDADAASAQGRASSAASSPSSSSSPAVKRRRSATVSLECCRTCRLRKVTKRAPLGESAFCRAGCQLFLRPASCPADGTFPSDKRTLQTSSADSRNYYTSRSSVPVIPGMVLAPTARGSSWPAALSMLIAQGSRQVGGNPFCHVARN